MYLNSKKIFSTFLVFIFLFSILAVNVAFAQKSPTEMLDSVAANEESGPYVKPANGVEGVFETTVGSVVKFCLSFLGMLFIILMIYAGFNWMTAGGDEQKVTKAKKTIGNALIGLLIVVCSYAIWAAISTLLWSTGD